VSVTSWKFPTVVVYTAAWSNYLNIRADDGNYASTTSFSTRLECYGFGFDLPSDAVIDGVEAAIHKVRVGGTSIYDLSVKIRIGMSLTGSDQNKAAEWASLGEVIYGGPNEWVSSLPVAEAEAAGFGVAISAYNNGDGEEGRIEYIKIRIYYHIPAAPTVTTQAADTIVLGGATLNGNITDDGGESITQHGFCWKSGSDPVNIAGADGSSTLGVGSEGAFDQAKTGLAEGTTFYYRAYATNSEGTRYGAAQSFTTGQTHSASVAITPAAGVAAEATKIIEGACPIGVALGLSIEGGGFISGACPIGIAVDQVAIGNRIAGVVCAIEPESSVESIANRIGGGIADVSMEIDLSVIANYIVSSASAAIGIELILDLDPNIYTLAAMAMTPGAGLTSSANVILGGVVDLAPVVDLVVAGVKLASAVAAITPDADVEARGNYITCAVAAIAIAVSQSALCTKVVHGAVAITVDTSVAATAIRYLLTIIGYSGEFGAGSVLEINSDKMTFILDGVNAIKDIVGSFANVPPGDSTVTYEDDEGTRDVTLDLEYTPRDA